MNKPPATNPCTPEPPELAPPAWVGSADLARLLERATAAGLLIFDSTGGCIYTNHEALDLFGATAAAELLGQNMEQLFSQPPGDLDGPGTTAGSPPADAPQLRRLDGGALPIDAWSENGTSPDGTHRLVAFRPLLPSATELGAISIRLLDELPGMAYRASLLTDRTIEFVSGGCLELTGYEREQLIGRTQHFITDITHPDDREWTDAHWRRCLAENRPYEMSFRITAANGSEKWVWERGHGVRDENGELLAIEAFITDTSEHHRLSQRLSYEAAHDPLTGLANRRAFEERLKRVMESARSDASEHALCYLDLDQFKVINDSCGHVAGDELLRQLSGILDQHIRKRDILARLGGDEFGVLMEHCSMVQARRAANALRAAIEEFRFIWKDKSFCVGASIGVVPINAASRDADSVLAAADSACYLAKDQGRNRVYLYQEDAADVARRSGEMEWVSTLSWALENDRLRLAYQPIWALDPGHAEGHHYEILVRMEGRDGALIQPGAFLPAAERYNLALRVDRWVIGAALDWLQRHPRHVEKLHCCSLNLGGRSIADDAFLAFLIERLRTTGIPANKLCFEITETVAIANLAAATRFMESLRGMGAHFAPDDFGSGLSSFAYLKALPVEVLKIDGIFVKDISRDPIDLAMVRSINDIGHVMGKRTIAEFVEDDAILERLLDVGVDYAQGYGVARPRLLKEMG